MSEKEKALIDFGNNDEEPPPYVPRIDKEFVDEEEEINPFEVPDNDYLDEGGKYDFNLSNPDLLFKFDNSGSLAKQGGVKEGVEGTSSAEDTSGKGFDESELWRRIECFKTRKSCSERREEGFACPIS